METEWMWGGDGVEMEMEMDWYGMVLVVPVSESHSCIASFNLPLSCAETRSHREFCV